MLCKNVQVIVHINYSYTLNISSREGTDELNIGSIQRLGVTRLKALEQDPNPCTVFILPAVVFIISTTSQCDSIIHRFNRVNEHNTEFFLERKHKRHVLPSLGIKSIPRGLEQKKREHNVAQR